MTLTIPQHRDPVARAALIASGLALAWLAVAGAMPPATAHEQAQRVVIVVATPTLPAIIPTMAPPPAAAPAMVAATMAPPPPAPTEAPVVVVVPVVPVQPAAPAAEVHEIPSDKHEPGARVIPPPVVTH